MDTTTLKALRDLITDSGKLKDVDENAYTVYSEDLRPETGSATVQVLPGARWETRYINGDGTQVVPFAVLIRSRDRDTNDRLKALEVLAALQTYLEDVDSSSLPTGVVSITGVDTPSIFERSEDGTAVWRATFEARMEAS